VNGKSEPPPRAEWVTDDSSIQCGECCDRIHRWTEEDPITQGGIRYRNWICPRGHRNRSMINSRGRNPRNTSDPFSGSVLDYAVAEHVFGWSWYWYRPSNGDGPVRIWSILNRPPQASSDARAWRCPFRSARPLQPIIPSSRCHTTAQTA
jgi:hypothetical protein